MSATRSTETWTEGKVTLTTIEGPIEIEASILGTLAVHRSVSDRPAGTPAADGTPWRVTHVPTGLGLPEDVGDAPTQAAAQARAQAFLHVAPELAACGTVEEFAATAERLRDGGCDWYYRSLDATAAILAEAEAASDPRAALYRAVQYVLDRAQTDPDLGYQLGPMTEAFRLLCLAEAAHLERPLEEVEQERQQDLQPEYRRRRARVEELDEEVQQLRALVHPAQAVVRGHQKGWGVDDAVRDLGDVLEEAGRAPGSGGDEGGGDDEDGA